MQIDKRVILSTVLVLLIGAVLAAYAAGESQRQALAAERQQAESSERGGRLYASLCAKCHGQTGEGAVGPAVAGAMYLERYQLRADAADDLRKAAESIRKTVARGRYNTAMPAWEEEEGGPLNREQIGELTAFLLHATPAEWAASTGEAYSDTPSDGSAATESQAKPAPPPASAADSVEAGKKLYASKGCIGCHGPKGEGGVGPALASFTEEQIFAQVRKPKGGMPSYAPNRLSDDDLRQIVRFIESLQ